MSQVLLAIAAGAWLLTPDWIAASAVAGMWLDEDKFRFEVCHAPPFCAESSLSCRRTRVVHQLCDLAHSARTLHW